VTETASPLPRPATSLRRGIGWNAGAFAIIGAAGVSINLGIANWYEPEVLGVFNTVLAVFIVTGQIGALGIHASVLYFVPVAYRRGEPTAPILLNATVLVASISAAVSLLIFLVRQWLASVFSSPDFDTSLIAALPGIWLFPINKVFLNYLNSLHRVRAYALGSAGRYLLLVVGVSVCIVFGWPSAWLAGALSLAEVVLAIFLSITCFAGIRGHHSLNRQPWTRRNLNFGIRALPAGVVSELNTRVDVLILGVLADARAVGIYSLASIFAEGLYQLVMVLRLSFDPSIAVMIHERRWADLDVLVRRGKRLGLLMGGGIGVFSLLCFPLLLRLLLGHTDFDQSWPVYAILVAGVVAASRYIPFSGLLQQAGHPGTQSTLFALVALGNAVGNVILVPAAGVIGSATATAASQMLYVLLLKRFVDRNVGFRL
jgi:O-antigen/teichoic acid export membrane protein